MLCHRPIVRQVNWAACCRLLARLGVCVIRRVWHVTRVYFNTEMKYGPCALESERGASRARDLPAVLILKQQQQQIVSRLSIRRALALPVRADRRQMINFPLSALLLFTDINVYSSSKHPTGLTSTERNLLLVKLIHKTQKRFSVCT